MFDELTDADVVDAITDAAREEAAGCARRLAAIGELYARRAQVDDVERQNWAIDGHANVVAEVSAALNVSRGRAGGQLNYAIALREQLPRVAAVFANGAIDFRMMAALVNRTDNVEDPAVLTKLDAALAKWAPTWMKMSGPKLNERIDMWVEKYDPAGLLREVAPTATITPLHIPEPVAEAGYRPKPKMARYIRCRDLTCRFPGCDAPAEVCDSR